MMVSWHWGVLEDAVGEEGGGNGGSGVATRTYQKEDHLSPSP